MEERRLFYDKFQPRLKEILGDLFELYVYIDGEFLKGDDAKLSVFDRTVRFGDGVFEGIRSYDGKIFKLKEHLERLVDSCKYIGIENLPLDIEQLTVVTKECIKLNRLKDAYIRINVSRGPGMGSLDPTTSVRVSVVVMAYPYPSLFGDKSVKLIVSSIRKKSPYAIDARAKTLNYLDSILAKLQARKAGADEAVMLDPNGFVAEATGENIFVVKNGKLSTPVTVSSLGGITRDTIFHIAKKLGYEVQERIMTVFDLYTSDEVFLTGTGAGVVAASEVDGRRIGITVPGSVTLRIMEAYKKFVREQYLTDAYS